jgi:hypothetical protein
MTGTSSNGPDDLPHPSAEGRARRVPETILLCRSLSLLCDKVGFAELVEPDGEDSADIKAMVPAQCVGQTGCVMEASAPYP